jgi:hypothetical protein
MFVGPFSDSLPCLIRTFRRSNSKEEQKPGPPSDGLIALILPVMGLTSRMFPALFMLYDHAMTIGRGTIAGRTVGVAKSVNVIAIKVLGGPDGCDSFIL